MQIYVFRDSEKDWSEEKDRLVSVLFYLSLAHPPPIPLVLSMYYFSRYIMTSEHTKEPTLEFFKKNNYFGLSADNVILFEQNLLPCIGFDGKIFMTNQHKVALAPGKLIRFWVSTLCKRQKTNEIAG